VAESVVWVWVETQDGKPLRISLEILSKARELGKAEAIVLGPGAKAVASTLGEYGAGKVYVHEDPIYGEYLAQPAVEALAALVRQHNPALLLFGSTYDGRDIASRLSARLDSGLITSATDIALKNGQVEVTVPAFGGRTIVSATIVNPGTKLVLVRPKAFDAVATGGSAVIEEVKVEISPSAMKSKIVERVVQASEGPKLEEANIIVAGGRGLGGPENLVILHELAKELGGAVGATRAIVDAGWVPYSYQIGQTGKTVKPQLYIACGISGAIQHIVGMKGSKTIVAINKDAEAPIFKIADYGVVGDVFKVLPQLIEEIRNRKKG